MKGNSRWITVAAILLVAGCGVEKPVLPDGEGEIRVVIVDTTGTIPGSTPGVPAVVEGAQVSLQARTHEEIEVTEAPDGEAGFEGLPAGEFPIFARCEMKLGAQQKEVFTGFTDLLVQGPGVVADTIFVATVIVNALMINEIYYCGGDYSKFYFYDQFVELLDLFQDKVDLNGTELKRLLVIPGIDEEDVTAIEMFRDSLKYFHSINEFKELYRGESEIILPFVVVLPPTLKRYTAGWHLYNRTYIHDAENPPYTSLKGSVAGEGMTARIYAKNYNDEPLNIRKRSLTLKRQNWRLVLGNYSESFGMGVLVGKYMYLSSTLRENDPWRLFFFPSDGKLNGLYYERLNGRFRPAAALSVNDYYLVRNMMLAGRLATALTEKISGAGIIYYGSLFDKETQITSHQGGFSISASSGKMNSFEVSILDNGALGAAAEAGERFKRTNLSVSGWAYSRDFVAMYSGGPAHYGREYVSLEDSMEIELYTRQAGERGAKLDVRFPIVKFVTLSLDHTYWTTPFVQENGLYSTGKLRIAYRGLSSYGAFVYDDRYEKGVRTLKETLRGSARYRIATAVELSAYASLRWTTETNDRFRTISTYVKCKKNIVGRGGVSLRLKRYDPDLSDAEDAAYYELALTPAIDVGDFSVSLEGKVKHYDDGATTHYEVRLNIDQNIPFEKVVREQ